MEEEREEGRKEESGACQHRERKVERDEGTKLVKEVSEKSERRK